MSVPFASIHITNPWGMGIFLVLWVVLFECAHVLVSFLRNEPLVGWAVGPLGITVMFLREPSPLFILLDVLFPATVSGIVFYIGFFTPLTPVALPHSPLVQIIVTGCGVLLTSTIDVLNALRDLRYPLWGEARILRNIQFLRASWASIHFTRFGLSYLHDRFGSNARDLLQTL